MHWVATQKELQYFFFFSSRAKVLWRGGQIEKNRGYVNEKAQWQCSFSYRWRFLPGQSLVHSFQVACGR